MLKKTACATLMFVGILFLILSVPPLIYNIIELSQYGWHNVKFGSKEIVFLISFISSLLNFWTGLRSVVSAKKGRPVLGLLTTITISFFTLIFYLVMAILRGQVTNAANLYSFCSGFTLQILLIINVKILSDIDKKSKERSSKEIKK